MKIFITGGTGFVGKFVIAELVRRKQTVFALVRNVKKARAVLPTQNITLIKGDLEDSSFTEKTLKKIKPDAIIHLAWNGIPDYGIEASIRNLNMSLALCIVAGKTKIPRMVVSGSCWEYGTQTGSVTEESPLLPMNPFTVAKKAFHVIGNEIARQFKFEFVWTRLFFVYGPGQKKTSLVPSLIQSYKEKKPYSLKNPKGCNDFIYVADVSRALVDTATSKKKLGINTLNVGSGKTTPVAYIADLIYNSKKRRYSTEKGMCADLSKTKRVIAWKPRVSIEKGVATTKKSFL